MDQTQSAMWQLSQSDFIKSATNAIWAAVIVALAGVTAQAGFDVFHADWAGIIKVVINAGFGAFVGDVARRLTSDQDGKIFGKIRTR